MSERAPAPDEQDPDSDDPDCADATNDPQSVERLLRRLAECTQEHAIMLLDREGRITWWNNGAERIFGLARSEAIGQPVSRLFTRARSTTPASSPPRVARSGSRGRSRIRRRWSTARTPASRSEGGLGIGLSLVKNLVTLHGGSVQAKSDGAGKGSEFTVRLPLKR